METSASCEVRTAPSPYPTNQDRCRYDAEPPHPSDLLPGMIHAGSRMLVARSRVSGGRERIAAEWSIRADLRVLKVID